VSISFTLARRYMAGRKLRTALTTLAIVLGVMLIFGFNGTLPGMMEWMRKSMLASVGEVDLNVQSASSALFDQQVADKVAAVDGVAAATPVLRRNVTLPAEPDYNTTGITVIGIDPVVSPDVRSYPVAEGRMLAASDDDTNARPVAVIPASTAQKMGLAVGDELVVPAASGAMTFEVVGTLDSPVPPATDEVYVSLPLAQDMFAAPGRASAIEAAFEGGADEETVQEAVADAVGDGYVIGSVTADSTLAAGFEVAGTIFNVLGLFALAMGGFIILNTFRTIVAERRHDIGMLRAIGASRRQILGLFLTESLVQGVLGTGLGLLAGWGFATVTAAGMSELVGDLMRIESFETSFSVSTWVLAITLGMGATVLSAILPAIAASRITPLDAMRPQLGDVYEKAATKRGWVGLALVAIAAGMLLSGNDGLIGLGGLLLLVGMSLGASAAVKPITDFFSRGIELVYRREGALARANLQRNPGRAGVTVSAVMISLALVTGIMTMTAAVVGGYAEYAEKATGTDYLVIPQGLMLSGGMVGAGPEMAEAVRSTEGVGDVATLRYAPAVVGDLTVQVVGIDAEEYAKVASFRYSEGSSDADLAKLADPDMVLANASFRAQTKTAKGDTVEIMTPEGARTFTIAGGGNDYINAKLPTVYVSQEALADLWGVTTDVMVLANATEGADKAAVLESLGATIDGFPSFKLYDALAWQQVQDDLFGQLQIVYYTLAVVLAIPSLLALLNTLAIGVLARTREIGMLRAVGATRRQVKRLVVAESFLLAAVGTAAGLVAGVPLGYVIVRSIGAVGLEFDFVWPTTGLVVTVIVGLLFAVLAAIIPARQAARLDVIRALRYE
jgi:putative ABC transport system permease protein